MFGRKLKNTIESLEADLRDKEVACVRLKKRMQSALNFAEESHREDMERIADLECELSRYQACATPEVVAAVDAMRTATKGE